ncbi:3-hydroxybutyrate dehydrogenase [Pollutimonas bauzanensis]|uniref:3-hydroxybutyrate dehydrogenase n=1 Tax=Pollutimonas bauzanensis TaxID=658167 RepID=A0A1M5QCW7_9BURK|nr:3-hydroxybutyrate dehydrogenase [Pollutimonas bauzanensis]SHH11985.1 3-hydroxybutyrate dehydrogenase [Pollutimonas bauzanensis]
MTLENKCALITGSVRGLGYAIAADLARAGCHIVLHGLEPEGLAQDAADTLRRTSGRTVLLSRADLARVEQIEELMHAARQQFGNVDIVVNNAVVRHFAPAEELPALHWDESIAVNLSAAFHTSRLAIPGMRARAWGRIINMSSVYGSSAAVNRVGYVTTKTGLIGMTRAIALETAASGITCNAVCPGTVPTPAILERIAGIAAKAGISQEQATRDYLAERQPTGRFVAMESVAAMVRFLCGDAGRDITGAVLPIDGGWTAA